MKTRTRGTREFPTTAVAAATIGLFIATASPAVAAGPASLSVSAPGAPPADAARLADPAPAATTYRATTTYSSPAVVGRKLTSTTTLTASTSVTGVIVYLEIDRGSEAVSKTSYSAQSLSSAGRRFTIDAIPAGSGTYTTKVMVFTAGWKSLLYSNGSTSTVNVAVEPTPAKWSAASTFGAAQATVNRPFTITTRVTAPAVTTGLTVRVYVENDGVGKRFDYPGRSVGPQGSTVTSDFTPTRPGTYTVKVGVYSADLKTLYYWTNMAGVFGTPAAVTGTGKFLGAGKSPRILALGDSITYGINGDNTAGTGGYRTPLWNRLKAKGMPVTPVGPQPGPPDGSRHAGYPGWRVRDLADGVPGTSPSAVSMMYAYAPDVVLLHIGTNDFGFRDDMANAAGRASALIDSLMAARPSARIFVARIVDSYAPVPMPEVAAYNDAVQAHVAKLGASGKRVYGVNVNAAVTNASDLGDGVHPTDATYARMAGIWEQKLTGINATLP